MTLVVCPFKRLHVGDSHIGHMYTCFCNVTSFGHPPNHSLNYWTQIFFKTPVLLYMLGTSSKSLAMHSI